LSIGCRSNVSNVRDATPFAKKNPLPPGCDDALYELAAYPDACHARGVGEGDGEADGDGDGTAPGAGVGVVCAIAGMLQRAHAAVKAATSVFKPPPDEGDEGKRKPCRACAPHGLSG
jgi:hypothetical protein